MAMSPKFLQLTRLRDSSCVMINPRRIDRFYPTPPPSQQPTLFCGTTIEFAGHKAEVVSETVAEIVRALRK